MDNKRWFALDLFKVIAMFLLVLVHCSVWLATSGSDRQMSGEDPFWIFYLTKILTYLGMFPMSLPITIGLSFRFMLGKYWNDFSLLSWVSVFKRAGILFLLGTLTNYLSWGLSEIWIWDILQFASISLILVVFVLKYISEKFLYAFGVIALFISPYLRDTILVKPEFYSNKIFMIILGDFEGDNFWPLFPWVFYVILGIFISSQFIKYGTKISNWLIACSMVVLLAIKLCGLSINMNIDLKDIWGPNFMLPETHTVLAIVCYAVLLIGLLMKWDLKNARIKNSISAISNQITLYYVFHLALGANMAIVLKRNFALSVPLLIVFWLGLTFVVFSFLIWVDKKIKYKKYLSIK